jgi:hypothetical protein
MLNKEVLKNLFLELLFHEKTLIFAPQLSFHNPKSIIFFF